MEFRQQERRLPPTGEPQSRKSYLGTYLYRFGDPLKFERFAADFIIPGMPIQPYGVLIPVAAHQEADRIEHSMAEYAAQEDAEPTTVFLSLNYPTANADMAEVNRSIDQVEAAKRNHPDLDIRYTVVGYDEPIIGQIRKDLWDAVMYTALNDGVYNTPEGEFIGINHDIDTERISRHYLRNVQQYYKDRQSELSERGMPQNVMSTRLTRVKHGYRFDTHPNISRGALWADFVYRQVARNGSYEEGMVIPLSYYARVGGFDEEARTHETLPLVPKDFGGIPGTSMDTSLRRYINRFGGYGYEGLWTTESFTANDECRVNESGEDISLDTLRNKVSISLPTHIELLTRQISNTKWDKLVEDCCAFLSGNADPISEEELHERVTKMVCPQIKLAQAVLARIIALPEFANIVGCGEVIEVAVGVRMEEVNRIIAKRTRYPR